MWYPADRLGSIRSMTNASGVEVKDYDYQAFGATQARLIYMGARYCAAPRSGAEWVTTPR